MIFSFWDALYSQFILIYATSRWDLETSQYYNWSPDNRGLWQVDSVVQCWLQSLPRLRRLKSLAISQFTVGNARQGMSWGVRGKGFLFTWFWIYGSQPRSSMELANMSRTNPRHNQLLCCSFVIHWPVYNFFFSCKMLRVPSWTNNLKGLP